MFAAVVGAVWYVTAINAENARLRAATSSAPAPAVAAPVAAAPVAARSLSTEQRQAMLEKLQNEPGRPVWFATVANNPEAAAYQKQLRSVFETAGWKIEGDSSVRFPMKPGVFVFAADEEPPDYLASVNDAFAAAGIAITSGRGYREFVRAKKEENPAWVGIELGPEDVYVIVIGRAG